MTNPVISPMTRYQDGIEMHRWEADPAQREVVAALDRLHQQLQAWSPRSQKGWLGRVRSLFGEETSSSLPKGLYIWGPVGRGKTFLMDLFAASLPQGTVLRRHFHQFMQEVHEALRELKHKVDPLQDVVADLASRARVLCLDEFLVDDIGDAMILSGLLRAMADHDMLLVTTSNTPPAELYKDGLQRARFLPAIDWLQSRCRVVELASSHDWRLRRLEQAAIYQTPPGPEALRTLERIFADYTHGHVQEGGSVDVLDRPIDIYKRADNIAWFTFAHLCDGPRSRADYVALAEIYPALIVSNVPIFTPDNHNAAKRFIHLVDALYDQRVKLIASAAAPIIDLYEGTRLRAEFGRTESRLIEMQSEDYLALPHRS